MGIVNINDDSFSGDGTLDPDNAIKMVTQMLREGADIIDLGAESARTNRDAISTTEECDRLRPLLDAWPKIIQALDPPAPGHTRLWPPLLSVNTWRPAVVETALEHGAELINDMSALPDPANATLCARHHAALLIMHSVGLPKETHTGETWDDLWPSLLDFFEEKIALAENAGLSREHLVLDPGIDFAKQRNDNLAVYRHLDRLHRFERPVLLPVSRKTVIGDVLHLPNPVDRDPGTLACTVGGLLRGAHIFRVHNIPAITQTLRTLRPLLP
jgi:dihydropteroate synthase